MWISRTEYKQLVSEAAKALTVSLMEDRLHDALKRISDFESYCKNLNATNLQLQDKLTASKSQSGRDSRQSQPMSDDDIFAESPDDVEQVLEEIRKVGTIPVLARLGAGDNAANS